LKLSSELCIYNFRTTSCRDVGCGPPHKPRLILDTAPFNTHSRTTRTGRLTTEISRFTVTRSRVNHVNIVDRSRDDCRAYNLRYIRKRAIAIFSVGQRSVNQSMWKKRGCHRSYPPRLLSRIVCVTVWCVRCDCAFVHHRRFMNIYCAWLWDKTHHWRCSKILQIWQGFTFLQNKSSLNLLNYSRNR